jgi:C-terminal binding protein
MIILIPDVLKPPTDIENSIFGPSAQIITPDAVHAEHIDDETWENCDAILAYDQIQFDASLISKLNNCKIIVRVGVGYDNVDLNEAKKRKIVVCNIPDYGSEEVADHVMALLLGLIRGLPEFVSRVRNRDWSRENSLPFRLRGKTMAIIGLGRTGTATAMRARAFGLDVIFYDPYVYDGYDKALGFERVESLNEVARRANIVSFHTPLTDETFQMFNQEFVDMLENQIILLNAARGSIINIKVLEQAMRDGNVKAAGLDVLPEEPNTDSQKLIADWERKEPWIKNRIILTPHVAFYSPEGYIEMRTKAALEAKRVLEGKPPRNQVNR